MRQECVGDSPERLAPWSSSLERFSEEDVEKLDEILEVVAKELTQEADSFHSVAIRKRKLRGAKA